MYGFSGTGHFTSSCLCFGLGPESLIFTKTLKVPIFLLRRLQRRVIIYMDDILLKSQTLEELMGRDTIIFLLTQLGFVINLKKSILMSVQQIEFLALEIDSVEMKLFLPLRNFRFVSCNRYKYRPKKKHDLRICGYSRPAGQRGALMVDNKHENLQWKISVNSTPRSNHIFRCIKEGLVCFVSRDYHRGSMVFSGENVAHKCSRIGSSEASNSFF